MRQISSQKKQQIIATAENLVMNGVEQPTNDQIREAMGGGSIADISPVMRQWREDRKTNTKALLEMPDSLKNAIIRFGAELWSVADSEAQKEIESVRQKISQQLIVVTDERDEALNEITLLEEKLQTQASSLDQFKIELGAEKVKNLKQIEVTQKMTTEKNTLKTLLNSSEKRANELAETLKVVQAQQAELQKELIALVKK